MREVGTESSPGCASFEEPEVFKRLECSDKRDMRILQCYLYIGIISDTLKGRVLISKDKFDKTMALPLEMIQQTECTPRMMSRECGHQFRCIEGVGPFLVPFNQFVGGPESTLEWDTPKQIPDRAV